MQALPPPPDSGGALPSAASWGPPVLLWSSNRKLIARHMRKAPPCFSLDGPERCLWAQQALAAAPVHLLSKHQEHIMHAEHRLQSPSANKLRLLSMDKLLLVLGVYRGALLELKPDLFISTKVLLCTYFTFAQHFHLMFYVLSCQPFLLACRLM
jgi:hypothetical protein